MSIKLAISPCPNDTFIFSGLLTGRTQLPWPVSIEFADIQRLNEAMAAHRFDLCKVSAVAAIRNKENYRVCRVGAALGYGVGPLIVSRPDAKPLSAESRVLAPGIDTTAYALFRHFFPEVRTVKQVVFSDIMPALLRGEADYGVVIHEGRFVYQKLALVCLADLGALWEERYKLPLPLGCLVAHRQVSERQQSEFEKAVCDSMHFAYRNKITAYETMHSYAQELDEQAIWQHVDLYVNQWSLDLGESGLAAFKQLGQVVATQT
jgi:1,4-dihydroxy-6-naphthoate synthase